MHQNCGLAPSSPRNLSVVAIPVARADGQQTVRVSWSPPLQLNGRVRKFEVNWSVVTRSDSITLNESAWNDVTMAASQRNVTIGNLSACSIVNVSVRAATCDGCWSDMALASATTYTNRVINSYSVNLLFAFSI